MKKTITAFTLICVFLVLTGCKRKAEFSDELQKSNKIQTETDATRKINNNKVSVNFTRNIELTNPRMNGDDVLALQERLLWLGLSEVGEADGYFGPLTEEVIKKLQLVSEFESNGKVNKALWDIIFSEKEALFLATKAFFYGKDLKVEDNENFNNIVASMFTSINKDISASTNYDYDMGGLKRARGLYEDSGSDGHQDVGIYYSPKDRKVKRMFYSGHNGWKHEYYYFISDTLYFVQYGYREDISNHEGVEEKIYLVNNSVSFEIMDGILRPSGEDSFINRFGLDGIDYLYGFNAEMNTGGYEQIEGDFIIDGKGTIITYTGGDKNLVIPSKLGGVPVTAIGKSSFRNMDLESITIPSGVTIIGGHAFEQNELRNITIPDSVKTIEDYAFFMNGLSAVRIPAGVNVHGERAFPRAYTYYGSHEGNSEPRKDFNECYSENGTRAGIYEFINERVWTYKGTQ